MIMAPCVWGVGGSGLSVFDFYAATLIVMRKNKQSHKTIRRRARRLGFENK